MGGLGKKCFGSSTLTPSIPSPRVGVIVWLAADYGAAALKEAPKPDAENPAVKMHDGEAASEGGREGRRMEETVDMAWVRCSF